jgi:tetratricopeptide (TPR) repeat protein
MASGQVFAKELQAQVQKSSSQPSAQQPAKYPNIVKWIEYGQYKEADAAIDSLLNKNENDIDALSLRAISYAKQYKLAPAQAELNRLLKKYPKNANLHYAQGLVYMNRQTSSDVDYIKDTRNLINSAIKEFVAAVNINSSYHQAYNAMGVATLKLGNKDDAEELFLTALKINPQCAVAYDNLGVLDLLENNLDAAEKNFKLSMKYNSSNPTAMYHLAQVETRRGKYSSALTWVNHSVHIYPSSSPAWNLQGELYLQQGNEPAAINSFKKAVNVKPENSRPYINLAGIYENRADEEFAMEQIKTVLSLNPGYQEGKLKVADLSFHTKKYDQAITYYSKLLGDEVYNDRAVAGLADTYYELSKLSGGNSDMTTNKEVYLAYDYANKALEYNPGNLKLHLAKLKLSSLTHQPAPSKDNLNYIVQNAGNTVGDAVIKAEAYLALGREKDAVYTFENAINFSANVDDDLYLAEILVHNKQFRTARTALKKALMKDPGNVIAKNGIAYIDLCEIKSNEFYNVALKQFKEKNYASTIEYCNRAIDFYHDSPEISKLKAQAYEGDKNYKEAAVYYTRYLSMSPNASDKKEVTRKINKFKNKK